MLSQGNKVIYSVGTSIREKLQFIELLKEYNLEAVVGVRRFSKSRFDYFCKDKLCSMLEKDEMEYVYLGDTLGGFRKKGYKEYTGTVDFLRGVEELKEVALKKRGGE